MRDVSGALGVANDQNDPDHFVSFTNAGRLWKIFGTSFEAVAGFNKPLELPSAAFSLDLLNPLSCSSQVFYSAAC